MAEPSPELVMRSVQRILDSQRETREDIREIKTRLGHLESEVANLHGFLAEQSIRLDRLGDRLERVERRLSLLPLAERALRRRSGGLRQGIRSPDQWVARAAGGC